MSTAEKLAKMFHDTYEELAPQFGYETREASRKPWDQVPENNRNLMIAVCKVILDKAWSEIPAQERAQLLSVALTARMNRGETT